MNRTNKRGFLLAEETLKIVIAVISITFLVYFLVSFYYAKIDDQKLREAEASLKRIKILFNGLNEGDQNKFMVPNPSGWYLFSFVNIQKPNSCAGESCLCICKGILSSYIQNQAEKCQEKGTCLVVPNLKNFEEIKIGSDGTEIFLSKNNGFIEIK